MAWVEGAARSSSEKRKKFRCSCSRVRENVLESELSTRGETSELSGGEVSWKCGGSLVKEQREGALNERRQKLSSAGLRRGDRAGVEKADGGEKQGVSTMKELETTT